MKQYKNLSELLIDRDNFPNSGRLYWTCSTTRLVVEQVLRKALLFAGFSAEVVRKLKFPNNSIIEKTMLCDIQNARYWLLSRKEVQAAGYLADGRSRIPAVLRGLNVQPFMGIATFAYIIDLKNSGKAGAAAGAVEAILFYLKNNSFMD